jgi:BirA family biotin operon repressor/biotin-[acetyl-CoA-carboxylase] ligase
MPSSSAPLDASLLSSASPWNIPVQVLEETSSSNDEMLRLGEAGCAAGTLLFAERQTAGRGQFQRRWNSARGLGLWFSLLLRLPINDKTIPSLSAFGAVALVEMLRKLKIDDCGIKAPNDLLISGRKVAGILVETRTGRNPFAVVGIGLNVNHGPHDFPNELRERAVSLAMITGSRLDRNAVAFSLIKELGNVECLMRESPEELRAAWQRHLLAAIPAMKPE